MFKNHKMVNKDKTSPEYKEEMTNLAVFNLSEKIGNRKKVETEFADKYGDFVTIRDVIDVEDVKEFIRLLKDKICITRQKRGQDYIDIKIEIEQIIDKLAGEKLK